MDASALRTVTFDLINFSLVVLILYFATRKAFALAIETRSDRVGAQVLEGQKLYEVASVLQKDWKAKWEGSKQEVAALTQEAQTLIDRTRQQTLERAKHEAERIRQESKLVAQGELARVINQLRKEFAHKSVDMARRYLETQMLDEDRKSLVKNYTETVGNGASR